MEDPMSDLTLDVKTHSKPASAAERAALLQNPAFGRVFTDHMITLRHTKERGWHDWRSEQHTSELQSLMRISYAVFCLKKKTTNKKAHTRPHVNTKPINRQTTIQLPTTI